MIYYYQVSHVQLERTVRKVNEHESSPLLSPVGHFKFDIDQQTYLISVFQIRPTALAIIKNLLVNKFLLLCMISE